MRFGSAFSLLLLPPLASLSAKSSYALERADFEWTQELSFELLKHCPVEECLLVGLGPSTTPVIASLEAADRGRLPTYLPLKNFGFGVRLGVPHLGFDEERKLAALFRELLPEGVIPASRKILLFEISDRGGEDLVAAKSYLESYSNREQRLFRILTAVVHSERDQLLVHPAVDFSILMADRSRMNRATRFDRFEMQSKYAAFQIEKTEALFGRDFLPRRDEVRSAYLALLEEMKSSRWSKGEEDEASLGEALKFTERVSQRSPSRSPKNRTPSSWTPSTLTNGFISGLNERIHAALTLKWDLNDLDFEERFKDLLEDPDREVRRTLCKSLFTERAYPQLRRLLLLALKATDDEVKDAAVARLTSRKSLTSRMSQSSDPASLGIGELDSEFEASSEQFETLKYLLDRAQPVEVRRFASRRISSQSDQVRMMLASVIAREEDSSVRKIAFTNLLRPIVARGRLPESAKWFEFVQNEAAKGVPGEQVGWLEELSEFKLIREKKLDPFLEFDFKERYKLNRR